MSTNPIKLRIMKTFNAIYQDLGERTFTEMMDALDGARTQLLEQLGRSRGRAREVERRTLDGILLVAIEYRRPLDEVLDIVKRMEAIGWSTLLDKALTLGMVADYCRRRRRRDLALRIVEGAIAELEAEDRKVPAGRWIGPMLDQLQGQRARYLAPPRPRARPEKPHQ